MVAQSVLGSLVVPMGRAGVGDGEASKAGVREGEVSLRQEEAC